MPFVKGQSGNPGGKPKEKLWRSAIERALERRKGKIDLKGIDEAADALISVAIDDMDISALKEIGDRLDGKSPQAIVGDPDAPIEMKMQSHFNDDDLKALGRHIDELRGIATTPSTKSS
jgi:hypothetical protein